MKGSRLPHRLLLLLAAAALPAGAQGPTIDVWLIDCPALYDRPGIYTQDADEHLRFTALDRAGVLGHVAGELGRHEIGIESVIQQGRGGASRSVPVLVKTHPAPERAVRRALEAIDRLPDVTAPTRMIRIEEGL